MKSSEGFQRGGCSEPYVFFRVHRIPSRWWQHFYSGRPALESWGNKEGRKTANDVTEAFQVNTMYQHLSSFHSLVNFQLSIPVFLFATISRSSAPVALLVSYASSTTSRAATFAADWTEHIMLLEGKRALPYPKTFDSFLARTIFA